jgi:hypothetical protein
MKNGPYPNHLAEFMRAKRLTDPALAKKLDISKQQIFNLRRWHRKLTVEWAKQLAPHLDVSWERLITGSPSPVDQDEVLLLAAFKALDQRDRQMAVRVLQNMKRDDPPAASPRSNGPDPPRPFVMGGRVTEKRNEEDCHPVVQLPVRRR